MPLLSTFSSTFGPCVEGVRDFTNQLQFATLGEYSVAVKQAYQDVLLATRSIQYLSYLTFRPLAILLYLVCGKISILAHFLFRQLFAGLWNSSKETFRHLKWCILRSYQWQCQRTWLEIQYELLGVATLIAIVLLRRHIQQQAYVQRTTKFIRKQKRRITKTYRSFLDRVSRTSLWLAMILPHVLFVSVMIFLRILFPGPLRYLARECNLDWFLSIAYPWCSTFAVVWKYRQEQEQGQQGGEKEERDVGGDTNSTTRKPLSDKKVTQKNHPPAIFTKTSPRLSPRYAAPTAASSRKQQRPNNQSGAEGLCSTQQQQHDEVLYWMHYWMVHAMFTASIRLLHWMPLVTRIFSRFDGFGSELQLLFFLWIYGLSTALTVSAQTQDDKYRSYQVRPLPLLISKATPIITHLYKSISQNILPSKVWKVGTQKVEGFLSLAATVRIISRPFADRIIGSLDDVHPMVIPAVALLMPFFAKYGVLYVQTVIPTHTCCTAVTFKKQIRLLQYWILATLFSGVLQWWSGILWWIPLSTHITFIIWCRLQFSFGQCFDIFVKELQAFGLLPSSGHVQQMHETYTAQTIRLLVKTLPSAADTVAPDKSGDESVASELKSDFLSPTDSMEDDAQQEEDTTMDEEPYVVLLDDSVPEGSKENIALRQRRNKPATQRSSRVSTRSSTRIATNADKKD